MSGYWTRLILVLLLLAGGILSAAHYYSQYRLDLLHAKNANRAASFIQFYTDLAAVKNQKFLSPEKLAASYLLSVGFDCTVVASDNRKTVVVFPTACDQAVRNNSGYFLYPGRIPGATVEIFIYKAIVWGEIFLELFAIGLAVLMSAAGFAVIWLLARRRLLLRSKIRSESDAARLQAVLDNAADGIVTFDRTGKIETVNPASESIFGYSESELTNKNVEILIAISQQQSGGLDTKIGFSDCTDRKLNKQLELIGLRRNGDLFDMNFTVSEFEFEGRRLFLASVRDISKRKKTDQILHDALEQAMSASKAKSEFLAMMSHEIRTPLNGVIGVLEILRDSPLTGDQLHLVETGRHSGEMLLQVINDILDFSKLEAGRLAVEQAPFQVKEITNVVFELLKHQAIQKGIATTINYCPHLPTRLSGDAGRISQVLINLMGNAIKFTDTGTVDVQVICKNSNSSLARIRFEVSDTGAGIQEQDREKIFTEFATLSPTYTRGLGGTGLGLAISKQLVELMRGEIGFDSEHGVGSTFWFEVDLAIPQTCRSEADDLPSTDGDNSNPPQPVSEGSQHRILLAEDNATNTMITKLILETAGYKVDCVVNGMEAVQAASRCRYDAILMDIGMAEMDGLRATAHIRTNGKPSASTPILALTAHVMASDKEKIFAAGLDDYLSKPFKKTELLAMIRNWTGRSVGGREHGLPPLTVIAKSSE